MGKTFINSQGTIVYMYLVVLHWCSNWTLTENQPGIAVFPALIIKGWLKTVWGWKYQWFGLFDRNLPQQVNERFPLGIRLLHHGRMDHMVLICNEDKLFSNHFEFMEKCQLGLYFCSKISYWKVFLSYDFQKIPRTDFWTKIYIQLALSSKVPHWGHANKHD